MKKKPTVIIGAGPAGLSCALGLREAHLPSLLIERAEVGGQLKDIPSPVDNFALGTFSSGKEAAEALQRTLRHTEDEFLHFMKGNVRNIDLSKLTVEIDAASEALAIEAANIVLATGYRVRTLGFVGSESKHVHYHSDSLSGPVIAVIGGGDSAVLKALALVRGDLCRKVYLITRGSALRARPDLRQELASLPLAQIQILTNAQIRSFVEGSKGHTLSISDSARSLSVELEVDSLLIKAGYLPNTEFLSGKLAMDENNHVLIDQFCRTSQKGVYAAGDITASGFPRIATAIGQGMTAAAEIIRQTFSGS